MKVVWERKVKGMFASGRGDFILCHWVRTRWCHLNQTGFRVSLEDASPCALVTTEPFKTVHLLFILERADTRHTKREQFDEWSRANSRGALT